MAVLLIQLIAVQVPVPEPAEWDLLKILVLILGYAITLALSGRIVRHFTPPPEPTEEERQPHQGLYSSGVIIGKCENLLTVTLVLMNEITGLSILFAAKSLVRKEDIRKDSRWYLGGMLVNLTWGVLMGWLLRIVLFGG